MINKIILKIGYQYKLGLLLILHFYRDVIIWEKTGVIISIQVVLITDYFWTWKKPKIRKKTFKN